MDKRKRRDELLSTRLKQEAELSRPAFSEQLHERICLVIERDERPSPAPERYHRSSTHWLWAAAAASLAVAISAIGYQLNNTQRPGPQDPVHQPQLASDTPEQFEGIEEIASVTDRTAAGVMIVDSALTTESWAHLDHDARVATELVLDQLPLDLLAISEEP